jgi:hypothetical protein
LPDVSANATVEHTETCVVLGVHKRSIVVGVRPAQGGEVELHELPNTSISSTRRSNCSRTRLRRSYVLSSARLSCSARCPVSSGAPPR